MKQLLYNYTSIHTHIYTDRTFYILPVLPVANKNLQIKLSVRKNNIYVCLFLIVSIIDTTYMLFLFILQISGSWNRHNWINTWWYFCANYIFVERIWTRRSIAGDNI